MPNPTQLALLLIDQYLDNKAIGTEILEQIAQELSGIDRFPDQILDKFNDIIQMFDLKKLNLLFDLVDYLTKYVPNKIQQLLRDKQFIEKLSSLTMESSTQHKTLCLLKIWHVHFSNVEPRLDELFELIEFLESMQIHLPQNPSLAYSTDGPITQKYQAAGNSAAESSSSKSFEKHKSGQNDPSMEKSAQIERIKSDVMRFSKEVDEIKSKDFLKNSSSFQLKTIEQHTKRGEDLVNQLVIIASDTIDDSTNKTLQRLVRKLTNIQDILRGNMDTHAGSNVSYKQESRNRNPSHDSDSEGSKSDDDIFRGKFSYNPRVEYEPRVVFTWNRLATYKTEQCAFKFKCIMLPKYRKGISFTNNEYSCEKWHYPSGDKRREIRYDGHSFNYNDHRCPLGRNCPQKDNCRSCHTFFEYVYHPNQYKRYQCKSNTNCLNKDCCPYWHTPEEEAKWKNILNECFKICRAVEPASQIDTGYPLDFEVEEFNDLSNLVDEINNYETHITYSPTIEVTIADSAKDDNSSVKKGQVMANNISHSLSSKSEMYERYQNQDNDDKKTFNLNKTLTCIEINRQMLNPLTNLPNEYKNYPFFAIPEENRRKNLDFNDELGFNPDLLALNEKYDLSKIQIRTYAKNDNSAQIASVPHIIYQIIKNSHQSFTEQ